MHSLTLGEQEELNSSFRDQLLYYEDLKPWKLYLRKQIWSHVLIKNELGLILDHAKEYLGNERNNAALLHYLSYTSRTAEYDEVKLELENFPSHFRVIVDSVRHTQANELPAFDADWVPTPELQNLLEVSHVFKTSAKDFITFWYENFDKEKKTPLFPLHRKRYYDWIGTKALYKISEVAMNSPRHAWKSILKQMVKNKMVDRLYF